MGRAGLPSQLGWSKWPGSCSAGLDSRPQAGDLKLNARVCVHSRGRMQPAATQSRGEGAPHCPHGTHGAFVYLFAAPAPCHAHNPAMDWVWHRDAAGTVANQRPVGRACPPLTSRMHGRDLLRPPRSTGESTCIFHAAMRHQAATTSSRVCACWCVERRTVDCMPAVPRPPSPPQTTVHVLSGPQHTPHAPDEQRPALSSSS